MQCMQGGGACQCQCVDGCLVRTGNVVSAVQVQTFVIRVRLVSCEQGRCGAECSLCVCICNAFGDVVKECLSFKCLAVLKYFLYTFLTDVCRVPLQKYRHIWHC